MAVYNLTVNDNGKIETKDEEPLNEEKEQKETKPENTFIQIYGSIGDIFTRALNAIYTKEKNAVEETNISKESAANDHEIIARAAISDNDKKEDKLAIGEPNLYVYATTSKDLESGELSPIFDELNSIVGNGKDRIIAVIEGNENISNKQVIIESYLKNNNVPLYHIRKTALDAIELRVKRIGRK